MDDRIYLDNAATTPLDPRVREEMLHIYKTNWGNPSGVHQFSKAMAGLLEDARESIAASLGAKPSEIIFTGSATESNNSVIKGLARTLNYKGNHIIISQIEHPSVAKTAGYLQKNGFEITALKVDKQGHIDLQDLKRQVRSETILVSVIYANNEIGTIQPLKEIAAICRQAGVLFHTDAVQAFGKRKIKVNELGIDLLTATAHKIYGPVGAALLYCRGGISFEPLLHGGGQEDGKRASTENIAAIRGFAKAVQIYDQVRDEENARYRRWKKEIIRALDQKIPDMIVNGDIQKGLDNIINISFKGADSQLLMMQLDRLGIAVSSGSACSSGSVKPSGILQACGIPDSYIRGTLRISMGRFNKDEQIERFTRLLPEVVEKVRKLS